MFSEALNGKGKEIFYLTTHSNTFSYGYMASNMVNDHSDKLLHDVFSCFRKLLTGKETKYFI